MSADFTKLERFVPLDDLFPLYCEPDEDRNEPPPNFPIIRAKGFNVLKNVLLLRFTFKVLEAITSESPPMRAVPLNI